MREDSIPAEVRRARAMHAASFNNDLLAIYRDLKRQTRKNTRRFISIRRAASSRSSRFAPPLAHQPETAAFRATYPRAEFAVITPESFLEFVAPTVQP